MFSIPHQLSGSILPILGLDKVGECLGLLVPVMVVVAVVVTIILRADVLHLVDAAALGASLDRPLTGHAEPDDVVGVSRAAGATGILLVTSRADQNWVLHSA